MFVAGDEAIFMPGERHSGPTAEYVTRPCTSQHAHCPPDELPAATVFAPNASNANLASDNQSRHKRGFTASKKHVNMNR